MYVRCSVRSKRFTRHHRHRHRWCVLLLLSYLALNFVTENIGGNSDDVRSTTTAATTATTDQPTHNNNGYGDGGNVHTQTRTLQVQSWNATVLKQPKRSLLYHRSGVYCEYALINLCIEEVYKLSQNVFSLFAWVHTHTRAHILKKSRTHAQVYVFIKNEHRILYTFLFDKIIYIFIFVCTIYYKHVGAIGRLFFFISIFKFSNGMIVIWACVIYMHSDSGNDLPFFFSNILRQA